MRFVVVLFEHQLTHHIIDFHTLDLVGRHLHEISCRVRIDFHLDLVVLVDGDIGNGQRNWHNDLTVFNIAGEAVNISALGVSDIHAVRIDSNCLGHIRASIYATGSGACCQPRGDGRSVDFAANTQVVVVCATGETVVPGGTYLIPAAVVVSEASIQRSEVGSFGL